MNRIIRITTLVENTAFGRGILAEHGLAFWVDTGSRRVLFDTGQGMVLWNNANKLDLPLGSTDAVAFSHGHYDHTGGLVSILETGSQPKVYAHPAAFRPKYARNDKGTIRDVGIPSSHKEKVHWQAKEIIWTEGPMEICEGLFVTGKIPRVTEFEDTGGQFFNDGQCQRPDPLIDDQAMFFESSQGTVVLLGCAHAGVVNTLQYIRQLTDSKPLHTVIGGMHLVKASRDRIKQTIEGLFLLKVQRLGPAHCTGVRAMMELWNALPGKCFPCVTGTNLEFEA